MKQLFILEREINSIFKFKVLLIYSKVLPLKETSHLYKVPNISATSEDVFTNSNVFLFELVFVNLGLTQDFDELGLVLVFFYEIELCESFSNSSVAQRRFAVF